MNEFKLYPDNILSDIFADKNHVSDLKQYMVLNQMITKLSEEDKLLLHLIYELKYSIDHIAEIMNIDSNDVIDKKDKLIESLSTKKNKTLLSRGYSLDNLSDCNYKVDIPDIKKINTRSFIHQKYPENLICVINNKIIPNITIDMIDGLNYVLSSICNDIELKIMKERFNNRISYKQIGIKYNIDKVKVSQIVISTIRKCRRCEYLQIINEGYLSYLNNIKNVTGKSAYDLDIRSVGLSNYTAVTLFRRGFPTVGSIAEYIYNYNNFESKKPYNTKYKNITWNYDIRGIGESSASEIEHKLHELNIYV